MYIQIGKKINFNDFKPPTHAPFWLLDISNRQLIVVPFARPGDTIDDKPVILTENAVPGLNYNPISSGGGGNRKISFSIPIIQRNETTGNSLIMSQFDLLRNAANGDIFKDVLTRSSTQFSPRPKIVMQYFTGLPLEYFVAKCSYTHKDGFLTKLGFVKYTTVQMEIILDEESPLFDIQNTYQKISSFSGQFDSFFKEGAGQYEGKKTI